MDVTRFTDRARKAVHVADRLARAKGLAEVGPGCLLAGLAEAGGLARMALASLGAAPAPDPDLYRDPPPESGRLPLGPTVTWVIAEARQVAAQ